MPSKPQDRIGVVSSLCTACGAFPGWERIVGAKGATLLLCPNCVPLHLAVRMHRFDGTPGVCLCSPDGAEIGETFLVDSGDYEGRFCRGHAIAFLLHALRPRDFARVTADAGGDPEAVFLLHGDFYTEEGVPWQAHLYGELPPEVMSQAEIDRCLGDGGDDDDDLDLPTPGGLSSPSRLR
jgi:hypothetical protein